MPKNLGVSRYRNGDDIPQVTDPAAWAALTTGAWCWYENNPANGVIYGKLYNWYAVHDPRGLAPAGWHVPSDAEWTTLETCLGGSSVAGGAMKETGTIHWASPNAGATNSSGWTGLPGGFRDESGRFGYYLIGQDGNWWSSTEYGISTARNRTLFYSQGSILSDFNYKRFGYSVRCIRD
jgi:uncharacterized protein (TIGR02145 family)